METNSVITCQPYRSTSTGTTGPVYETRTHDFLNRTHTKNLKVKNSPSGFSFWEVGNVHQSEVNGFITVRFEKSRARQIGFLTSLCTFFLRPALQRRFCTVLDDGWRSFNLDYPLRVNINHISYKQTDKQAIKEQAKQGNKQIALDKTHDWFIDDDDTVRCKFILTPRGN